MVELVPYNPALSVRYNPHQQGGRDMRVSGHHSLFVLTTPVGFLVRARTQDGAETCLRGRFICLLSVSGMFSVKPNRGHPSAPCYSWQIWQYRSQKPGEFVGWTPRRTKKSLVIQLRHSTPLVSASCLVGTSPKTKPRYQTWLIFLPFSQNWFSHRTATWRPTCCLLCRH